MDITLVIALAAATFLLLLGLALFLFISSNSSAKPRETRTGPPHNRARDDAPRRAQIARNRGARMRPARQEEADVEEDVEPHVDTAQGKLGAKKAAKLEAKAEKKAQREAEEQQRVERKNRERLLEEERKKAEEKLRDEEKEREEEERRLLEEKRQREHDEYVKMKAVFSVEEEGFDNQEIAPNQLQEFVDYVKRKKVVVIEDLAAEFKMKTQATIERIKDLQNDDILTGVIDDRGKFIYVSPEEMQAVVKFINQRGRVSFAELAESSNSLINLTPVT